MNTSTKRPGGGHAARGRVVAAGGKQINVTLAVDDVAMLGKVADHYGTSRSEVIRLLIRRASQEITEG